MVQSVQQALLKSFTPPSVVINVKGDIIYVNGHTSKYLELAPGQASLNVFSMVRERLHMEIMNAVHEVSILKKVVTRNNLRIKTDAQYHFINITVKPFSNAPSLRELIMIVFEDVIPQEKLPEENTDHASSPEEDSKILDLEKELIYTKRYLQNTIEEMESSLEELTLTNEEIQSTNEELQSANEELMTS